MAHCYGCRVEVIIVIFVQVVLDVVDESTALTNSFHFFSYLRFSDFFEVLKIAVCEIRPCLVMYTLSR